MACRVYKQLWFWVVPWDIGSHSEYSIKGSGNDALNSATTMKSLTMKFPGKKNKYIFWKTWIGITTRATAIVTVLLRNQNSNNAKKAVQIYTAKFNLGKLVFNSIFQQRSGSQPFLVHRPSFKKHIWRTTLDNTWHSENYKHKSPKNGLT